LARGFRIGSGIGKLLLPVVVVGAVGFAIWYLAINPSSRVFNLFGFLAPPIPPPPPPEPLTTAGGTIPVRSPAYKGTGEFGTGFTPFAGATREDYDYGSDIEEDYDKINVSS
jgi:hypothetical protein